MLIRFSERRELEVNQLSHRLRACLSSRFAPKNLLADEPLYLCGSEDNDIYFIETGCLKIIMFSSDGKECLLNICTQGDIVGESGLSCPERAEAVIAMTPSVVRAVPRDQFLEILTSNHLVEEFLQYFALKLSEQQEVIRHFVTSDSERRLAVTLLRLSRKLGEKRVRNLKITQEELAGIVGTTRSRVGYFLKRFRAAGLVEVTSQSLLLINEDMLRVYLGEEQHE